MTNDVDTLITDVEHEMNDMTHDAEAGINQALSGVLGTVENIAAGNRRFQQDADTVAAEEQQLSEDTSAITQASGNVMGDVMSQVQSKKAGAGAAPAGRRLQQGDVGADIGALDDSIMGTITDLENDLNTAETSSEHQINEAITGLEDINGGTAAVADPARFQQGEEVQDTEQINTDVGHMIEDAIDSTNDQISNLAGVFTPAAGAAPAAGRRLQRFH